MLDKAIWDNFTLRSMNLDELSSLAKWFQQNIVATQVAGHYELLINQLRSYAQPNQRGVSFEGERVQLLNVLRAVPLDSVSKEQLEFLSAIEVTSVIGEAGASAVEDLLNRNAIDAVTSADKLQLMLNKIQGAIQRFDHAKAALEGIVSDPNKPVEDNVLLRVYFQREASIDNLSEFKEWGRAWFDIGRGIAMAHDTAPEAIRVVGASKGSVILELLTNKEIAATVGGIILAALTVADRVLSIRKKAEELRSLKLKNTKLAEELEAEAKEAKESGVTEISVEFTKKLRIKANEGDKSVALEKSVETLVDFVTKGGEVDFTAPEAATPDQQPALAELRATFSEIRHLEAKLLLLGHTPAAPKPE